MDNLNILIADKQPFTRIGISSILSAYFQDHLTIVEVADKEVLFQTLQLDPPHVLIIDFITFGLTDLSDFSKIRRISPNAGILVITDDLSIDNIVKVFDNGITTYVLKSAEEHELIEAFNATVANRKYFSSQVLDVLLEHKSSIRHHKPGNSNLTVTEQEIVRLIAQGYTTKGIANLKKLSYHTIITHRKNIFRKLNINNMSELILHAMRTGIIDTTEYYI